MTLTVDRRERALSAALGLPHAMVDLPVGDVVCRYEGGAEWVLERKTVRDLADSIRSPLSGDCIRARRGGHMRVHCVFFDGSQAPAVGKSNNPDSLLPAISTSSSSSKAISGRRTWDCPTSPCFPLV